MEYIQTVLFQVDAARLDQASQPRGLLADLDDHREFLKQQPGFRDLRITRSINPEGNVLVVIETRWSDDASLVRYETNEPNVAGIVNNHRDIIFSDSLQVLDMEALRTETSFLPAEHGEQARQRVVWPILIPAGVLAFTLLVIYGLSRVYLEIRGDGATALAAGISIGILIVAFYLASNRNIKGWQIGGVMLLVGAVLFGATIWAVAEEDEGEAEEHAEEPGDGEAPPPGEGVVVMDDNFFLFNDEENPDLSAEAGVETTLDLVNDGSAPHNMRIAGPDGEYTSDDDAVSDPDVVNAGEEATITFTLDAGTYDYQCDFHPTQMLGEIVVE